MELKERFESELREKGPRQDIREGLGRLQGVVMLELSLEGSAQNNQVKQLREKTHSRGR